MNIQEQSFTQLQPPHFLSTKAIAEVSWLPVFVAAALAQSVEGVSSSLIGTLWYTGIALQLYVGYRHFIEKA